MSSVSYQVGILHKTRLNSCGWHGNCIKLFWKRISLQVSHLSAIFVGNYISPQCKYSQSCQWQIKCAGARRRTTEYRVGASFRRKTSVQWPTCSVQELRMWTRCGDFLWVLPSLFRTIEIRKQVDYMLVEWLRNQLPRRDAKRCRRSSSCFGNSGVWSG